EMDEIGEIAVASEPRPAFAIDPDAIDRPAKPQSSLGSGRESPFDPAPVESPKAEPLAGLSNSTRANFIEAARRPARQPEPEPDAESHSLIGRALARFQGSEAEAAEKIAPEDEFEPLAEDPLDADMEEEPRPAGFFARNRRVLLLGTALVVVVAMAVPLIAARIMPPRPAPVEDVQSAAPAETQPADDAVGETASEAALPA